MEGLFHPDQFTFPTTIDKNKILKSIVKVKPVRTLEYNLFQADEDADKYCETYLDRKGFETIQYGFTESDKLKCDDPEFSQALFTYEFCQLLKSNTNFPTKTPLLGHGTGFFISTNGYIATNFHLISGAVEYLKKTDGYSGSENLLIHNIEIEYPINIIDSVIEYKKASKVFLAGTHSKSDAFGKRLDLAILKIDETNSNYLPLSKTQPSKFDQIFSVGFSMRTARKDERKKLLGYEDAKYDLRISSGHIVKIDGENSFLADTDGAPGNSGSAAINEKGELVGIYCGSTGNGIVDPNKSFRRYVPSRHLLPLTESKKLS